MTLAYTYNGSAITHKIPPTSLNLPTRAELGNISIGSLVIEDPGATLTIVGHKPFVIEDSACSQPRLWTGWTTDRGYGRSFDENMFIGADARILDVSLVDLNALFGFRIISGSDGKRPAETFNARMAWILGSSYLSGLIADTGFVVSNTTGMDAADYRGSYPGDVMTDFVDRSAGAYTFFAFWDVTAAAVGLWVGHLDDAVSNSTLRISNVKTDLDSVTFEPTHADRLVRQPDQTYSEVIVEYAGGKSVFRRRQSTEVNYIRRGTKISRPHTGQAATAATQAQTFLNQHANEIDRISATIRVPAASVGLVTAGQRMDVRFSQMPGYASFASMRVMAATPKPIDDLALFYDIALELVAPRAATNTNPCASPTATGSYWPMGSFISDATGNVAYCKAGGLPPPIVPTPGFVGDFFFHVFGAGGPGTTDFAGNLSANEFRLIVVGPGQMTVHTAADSNGPIAVILRLIHFDGANYIVDDTQTGSSGDTFVFDVPYDGYCNHYVSYQINGVGGTGFGFSGFDWVAGEVDIVVTLPPAPGTTILSETPTPTPNGTAVTFTLANAYRSGSLLVYVDGIPIPTSQVTETDPAAGSFTLSWAPDADEHITVLYVVA